MKTQTINRVKKIVGILVVVLVGVFIVRIFLGHAKQIQASIGLVSWVNIVLSIVLFLGYFYARALSWNLLIKSLGSRFKLKDSLFAWFAGESTRYIPGNIWSFASRYYLSYIKGVPKTNVILSMLLEILILLPVTLCLSVPALMGNYGKVHISMIIVFIVIIILCLAAGGLLISKKGRELFSQLRNIPFTVFSSKSFWGAVILQLAAWTVFGFGNYFLIQPFAGHISFIQLVSISVLAWFVGYVSIVTPMGLGVREGAIILLLSASIGQAQAGLAAVLSRVVLTAAEGLNLLFWFYTKKKPISDSLRNTSNDR